MAKRPLVNDDPWCELRQLTAARIALGRSGGSLPTREWLDFKLAHARARDAVHCVFEPADLVKFLSGIGVKSIVVESQAENRHTYLQRPDLGRRLGQRFQSIVRSAQDRVDLAIIVSDGLSARAVHDHAAAVLSLLIPKCQKAAWKLGPVVVARFGRVALEDEIGMLMRAKLALMLIGERPGLGSPDSLGAYLVFNPKLANTDANRNCVSNIRPAGLSYERATDTLYYLLNQARERQLSGVRLKDDRTLLDTLGNPIADVALGKD